MIIVVYGSARLSKALILETIETIEQCKKCESMEKIEEM